MHLQSEWYLELLILIVQLLLLLSVDEAVVYFVTKVLILLLPTLHFMISFQSTIHSVQSFFFCSTVVFDHLVHLTVLNHKKDVYLAHLRYFDGFFDKSLLSLALKINSLQLIVDGMLLLLLLLFTIVHHHLVRVCFLSLRFNFLI